MFSRIVHMEVRPEKAKDFIVFSNVEVVPLLKKQPGFVDMITFLTENTTSVMTCSIWKTKADLENYAKTTFPTLHKLMMPYLLSEPKVEVYSVFTSTFHKIAAGMSA